MDASAQTATIELQKFTASNWRYNLCMALHWSCKNVATGWRKRLVCTSMLTDYPMRRMTITKRDKCQFTINAPTRERKQRGSKAEENQMLIAELETLRGELIQAQEKYDRLSEVTNFHTIERLPGETNEEIRKHRQITYNQRAYLKKKK
jgi:hypothetical protein